MKPARCRAEAKLCGRSVTLEYSIRKSTHGPTKVSVDGQAILPLRLDANPYRRAGVRVPASRLHGLLREKGSVITVEM